MGFRETGQRRRLRQAQTPSEARLWQKLRNRGLSVKFRRQHQIGRYVVDFACIEARLVIELEGGVHGFRTAEDELRYQTIEAENWLVVSFPNEMVWAELDRVLDLIRAALRHAPSP